MSSLERRKIFRWLHSYHLHFLFLQCRDHLQFHYSSQFCSFCRSQNHGIIQAGRDLGNHLIQSPAQSRSDQIKLLRAVSSQVCAAKRHKHSCVLCCTAPDYLNDTSSNMNVKLYPLWSENKLGRSYTEHSWQLLKHGTLYLIHYSLMPKLARYINFWKCLTL